MQIWRYFWIFFFMQIFIGNIEEIRVEIGKERNRVGERKKERKKGGKEENLIFDYIV